MSSSQLSARVAILVKALPQPSKKYGETVCCAGVTVEGKWKRLYPVRYRHLAGDSSFTRWHWVKFDYGSPVRDHREESCHVHEESIHIDGVLKPGERADFLNKLLMPSAKHAAEHGRSLALVRPNNTKFIAKPRSKQEVANMREAYVRAAKQLDIFDKELASLEPSPYDFRFEFEDASGKHNYQCGDWEVHAMYWGETKRKNSKAALNWMDHTFNVEYPKKGMVFALGNQAKRPQTWQLLGVIRLDEQTQEQLLF